MLIFIAVGFVCTAVGVGFAFVVAARRSRQDRENAIEAGSNTIYRGPISLNSDGGFDSPGLYEIVVLPEQIQIRRLGRFTRIASAEWFLDPGDIEAKPAEARFLWTMRRRAAISIRYKPSGAVVSFLLLASDEGRDAELLAALDGVIKGAKAQRDRTGQD